MYRRNRKIYNRISLVENNVVALTAGSAKIKAIGLGIGLYLC